MTIILNYFWGAKSTIKIKYFSCYEEFLFLRTDSGDLITVAKEDLDNWEVVMGEENGQ